MDTPGSSTLRSLARSTGMGRHGSYRIYVGLEVPDWDFEEYEPGSLNLIGTIRTVVQDCRRRFTGVFCEGDKVGRVRTGKRLRDTRSFRRRGGGCRGGRDGVG